MLTVEQARQITEETIQYNIRHKEYDRTVEIARKCQIFITGTGQDSEYLLTLRDKETERQKKIRVKVTKPITPIALNPIKTQYEKIFRVDGVTLDIRRDNQEEVSTVNAAIEKYNSDTTLNQYLERRYLHWNFLDPNGFHIVERNNIPDENGRVAFVQTYPLEVTAEQAINYQYKNGVCQWLVVEQQRMEEDRAAGTKHPVSDFFFYAAGIALEYREFVDVLPETPGEIVLLEQEQGQRKFVFNRYDTGSKEFPGNKWGAYDCPEGDGTVKVPPFWPSRHILEDLIETKSIFDVSKHNHVFPKLFHYDQRCNYQNEAGAICQGGYLDGMAKQVQCPQCEGTGGKLHFTESDVVTFELPENLEDFSSLPKLQDLAWYHEPPLAVTQELYKWINDFREWVYLASFNTSNIEKPVAPKTATEIDKLWEEINTRVYHCAVWLSRTLEKTIRITAQYQGKDAGLVVKHTFPRDMKLEPLDVLIARYKMAKDAGVSYDISWAIHCSILGKMFLDNPQQVEEIKAWEYWKPFKSMDEQLTLLILQSRSQDDFDRVLYENWDRVKQLVESEFEGKEVTFAKLEKPAQLKRIVAAVEKVKESVGLLEETEPIMPDFTADPEPDNEPEPEPAEQ